MSDLLQGNKAEVYNVFNSLYETVDRYVMHDYPTILGKARVTVGRTGLRSIIIAFPDSVAEMSEDPITGEGEVINGTTLKQVENGTRQVTINGTITEKVDGKPTTRFFPETKEDLLRTQGLLEALIKSVPYI